MGGRARSWRFSARALLEAQHAVLPCAVALPPGSAMDASPCGSFLGRVLVEGRRPPIILESFAVTCGWGKVVLGVPVICRVHVPMRADAREGLKSHSSATLRGFDKRVSEVRIFVRVAGATRSRVVRLLLLLRRKSGGCSLGRVPPKRRSLREKDFVLVVRRSLPKQWEAWFGRSRASHSRVHGIRVRVEDLGRHFSALPVSEVDLRR